MMRRGFVLLSVVLLCGAGRAWAEEKKDAKSLEGTWKVVSAEENGQPKEGYKDAIVTFHDGTFTVKTADGNTHDVSYKVMRKGTGPASIDMTAKGGPNDGKTFQGIFEVEGDTLRICRGATPDKERPTEFTGKADAGTTLVTLKREKP